jgi:hypothetical protein
MHKWHSHERPLSHNCRLKPEWEDDQSTVYYSIGDLDRHFQRVLLGGVYGFCVRWCVWTLVAPDSDGEGQAGYDSFLKAGWKGYPVQFSFL